MVADTDHSFKGLEDFKVDELSLLSLHKSLVDISSVSKCELKISQVLKDVLEKAGLTVELQTVSSSPQRYNVYAYIGKVRDTKVLVTSHIDTVPNFFPYSIEGTKIYGRGSCDAKGSVATQIMSYLSLFKSGDLKEGDASLLFVVDEEFSGLGMRTVSKSLNASWETGIFGEPTDLKLGVGHKGIYAFEIEVNGKASHSGYPELGISATEILVPVLDRLLKVKLPESKLLGPSTLNIGIINAGVAQNVLPAKALASIMIRVAEDLPKVREIVLQTVSNVDHMTLKPGVQVDAQFLDHKVPGFDSIILSYSTDIPRLSIELKHRFLYGPGNIHVAHSDNECIENSSLIQAIDGYKKLIKHAL